MKIQLNGESRNIVENSTISSLVQQLGLSGSRYAVEVNEQLIPRSRHQDHILHEGDVVEVVQAIGGG